MHRTSDKNMSQSARKLLKPREMQPISQLRVTLRTNYQVQQISSYGLAVMFNYIDADIFRIFLNRHQSYSGKNLDLNDYNGALNSPHLTRGTKLYLLNLF